MRRPWEEGRRGARPPAGGDAATVRDGRTVRRRAHPDRRGQRRATRLAQFPLCRQKAPVDRASPHGERCEFLRRGGTGEVGGTGGASGHETLKACGYSRPVDGRAARGAVGDHEQNGRFREELRRLGERLAPHLPRPRALDDAAGPSGDGPGGSHPAGAGPARTARPRGRDLHRVGGIRPASGQLSRRRLRRRTRSRLRRRSRLRSRSRSHRRRRRRDGRPGAAPSSCHPPRRAGSRSRRSQR